MKPTTTASLKTAGKFIFWSMVGAGITAALNQLPNVQLPEFVGMLIGAGGKMLLTYVTMKLDRAQ